jgi:hypothetical protein
MQVGEGGFTPRGTFLSPVCGQSACADVSDIIHFNHASVLTNPQFVEIELWQQLRAATKGLGTMTRRIIIATFLLAPRLSFSLVRACRRVRILFNL